MARKMTAAGKMIAKLKKEKATLEKVKRKFDKERKESEKERRDLIMLKREISQLKNPKAKQLSRDLTKGTKTIGRGLNSFFKQATKTYNQISDNIEAGRKRAEKAEREKRRSKK